MGITACTGGGSAAIPEIQVDPDRLQELIQTAIQQNSETIREFCTRFPVEIANADPHPFLVPDTDIQLTKQSPDQDIAMAAIEAAFGSQTRTTIKDNIWKQLEPRIDAQLNDPDISEKTKQNAKTRFKENTVDTAVDTAMDEERDRMKSR